MSETNLTNSVPDPEIPAGPKLQEPRKPDKIRYTLRRKSFLFSGALLLIALFILFRLIGYWGFWSHITSTTYTQVFLPVLCALLLIVFLPVFANHGLWMTSIPIVLEAVFFILETGHISVWWVKAVSILLYIVISIIYTMTVFGKIPSKWPLVISIGVPLVYHLAVQDRTSLLEASSPDTLVAWMPEISAMSFVLALLLITLAMVKKVTTYGPPVVDPRADLAQIRDLKYVPEELEYHSMIKARREKKKAAAASTEPAPPLPEGEELLLEDPEEIAPPTPSYEDES